VVKNCLLYQSLLDNEDETRIFVYETELKRAKEVILLASLISVGVIVLLIALYMFPIVRSLVEWQADILNTLISVPQPLVRWWYASLIRKLEEDFREEDITAELYFYLQQRDDAEAIAAASNRKSPKKKPGEGSADPSKRIKATTVTGSIMPAARRMHLSIHTVLNSMGQRHIFIKLFLSSLIIIALPSLSLIPLSSLNQADAIARQLKWLSESLVYSQRVHYEIREAAIQIYGGGNATQSLADAKASLGLFIEGSNQLVYGDGVFDGLQSDGGFQKLIFDDACKFIDPAAIDLMVVQEDCEKFDSGIMTVGLKAAMFKFQQLATLSIQQLSQGVVTAGTRSNIILMESYLPQIGSVCVSMLPMIGQVVSESHDVNMTIVQPIQLVLAILCCLFLYFAAYMPFVKALENDTYSLHHVLNILWKSADGIQKSKAPQRTTVNRPPRLATFETSNSNNAVDSKGNEASGADSDVDSSVMDGSDIQILVQSESGSLIPTAAEGSQGMLSAPPAAKPTETSE
jgi:hypothetical protein